MADGVNRMRSIGEVGHFPGFSGRVNDAYRAYASLHLDYVDADINSFSGKGRGPSVVAGIPDGEDAAAEKAFLDVAGSILNDVVLRGDATCAELVDAYPPLSDYLSTRREDMSVQDKAAVMRDVMSPGHDFASVYSDNDDFYWDGDKGSVVHLAMAGDDVIGAWIASDKALSDVYDSLRKQQGGAVPSGELMWHCTDGFIDQLDEAECRLAKGDLSYSPVEKGGQLTEYDDGTAKQVPTHIFVGGIRPSQVRPSKHGVRVSVPSDLGSKNSVDVYVRKGDVMDDQARPGAKMVKLERDVKYTVSAIVDDGGQRIRSEIDPGARNMDAKFSDGALTGVIFKMDAESIKAHEGPGRDARRAFAKARGDASPRLPEQPVFTGFPSDGTEVEKDGDDLTLF